MRNYDLMKKVFLVGFLVVMLAELVSQATALKDLHLLSKPLIMLSLGAYYVVTMRSRRLRIPMPMLMALVFSFLGDVALMGSGEIYFMLGLVSFLLAHIAYIVVYRQLRLAEGEPLLQVQRIRFSLPFILAGTGLVTVLYPHLNELKVPVMIYAAVLVMMVLNAMFRYGLTSARSFWPVFLGAFAFMVSDSLLAFDKFVQPIALSGVWIMSSYMLAQFLIVWGVVNHPKE
jgi:uncharacterized membrane protein YhhN